MLNKHSRFKVRKGNKGWMVWDSETQTTPEVDGKLAVGLSAETAWQFAERLNDMLVVRKQAH